MHNALVINAIEGCISLVNCPTSGWMTDPLFLKLLQHIKQNICCSKEEPILVLLDNHENHCKPDAILYCRQYHLHLPTSLHSLTPATGCRSDGAIQNKSGTNKTVH